MKPECLVRTGLDGLFVGLFAALATMAAAAVISGCQPDSQRQQAQYRQVLGTTAPAPRYDPSGPLSLRLALELANWNNEHLAIGGEQYVQALIDKDRAVSRFLPTVSLAPSYTRQPETHLGGGNPLINEFVPPHALDVPLSVNEQLNLPADVTGLLAAIASAAGGRQSLLDLQQTILLDAARMYFQVVRSEQDVAVLDNSVRVQKAYVRYVENRHRAGAARTLDVAQANAQLSGTAATLIRAQADAKDSRAMLALLIGVPSVDGALSEDLDMPSELPDLAQLLASARQNRPDLKAAQQQVAAATHVLQAAWSQYFPSVNFNFAYYFQRQSFPQDVPWSWMAGLNVPIFSAGLIYDDIRTAASRLRQAELAQSYLERSVLNEARQGLTDLTAARRQIAELDVRVAAAAKALGQSTEEYKVGLATNLERLISQDQLLSAQLQLTDEKISEKTLYMNLLRVIGCLRTDPAQSSLPPANRQWPSSGPTTRPATSQSTSDPITSNSTGGK